MSMVRADAIDKEAVLRALNINVRDPKHQAMLLICERYNLDPVLKHVVLISGNAYVTRDGLLHVAHQTGMLDGIVVEDETETDAEWQAKVTVYVKGQTHGYTYRGRYPKSGQQKRYGAEMAVKCAEVMALRRAFGVTGIPTVEEQWDKADAIVVQEKPALKSSGGGDAGSPSTADVASPGEPAPDHQAPTAPPVVEPVVSHGDEVGTAPPGGSPLPGGNDAPTPLKAINERAYQSLNRKCRAIHANHADDDKDTAKAQWEAMAWACSGGRTTHLGELSPDEASRFRTRMVDLSEGRSTWAETNDPAWLGWTLEATA